MFTKKKIILIVAVLVLVGAIIYFITKKKKDSLKDAASTDPFDIADTEAYNAIAAYIESQTPNAMSWIAPIVGKEYKLGTYKIGGKASKARTLTEKLTQFNPNASGTNKDKNGNNSIWSQDTIDTVFSDYYLPFKAKFDF